MLKDGNLIEGVGIDVEGVVAIGYAEHASVLYVVVAVPESFNARFDFGRKHIGEKAQASGVDAYDGNAFVTDGSCCFQKCAVAAYTDGKGCCEVVALNDFLRLKVDVERGTQKVVELGFDGLRGTRFGAARRYFADVGRLARLIRVAEDGVFRNSVCHDFAYFSVCVRGN